MDGMNGELEKEKAMSASLKLELEAAALKVQTIAVDAELNARAELMREFKRAEHTSWDPTQEFQTWKRREVVLAVGEDETDEEELPLVVGSSKQVELGDSSKKAKPKVGAGDVAGDAVAKEDVEPIVSQEDITKDWVLFFFCFLGLYI